MAGTDDKWSWPYELPLWGEAEREVRREEEIIPGREEPPQIFPEDVRRIEGEEELKRTLRVISQGVDNWFPNDEPGGAEGAGKGGGGGGRSGGSGGSGGKNTSGWGSLGPQPPRPPSDIDACAWYYSFRYPKLFGISICIQCLAHFEYVLRNAGASKKVASACAFRFLYRHELFHYRVDRAVETIESALEIENGFPIRLWFRKRDKTKFNPAGRSIELLEEACANLDGWKAACKEAPAGRSKGNPRSQRDIVKRALAAEMMRMPPGYKDFAAVDRPHTRKAHATLVSQFILVERAHRAGPPTLPDLHLGMRHTIPLVERSGFSETDPSVPLYFVNCR